MKFIGKKLRSRRGETFIGILIAILIVALSAGLFAAMYTASTNINLSAQKSDEQFYDAVGTLEGLEQSEDTQVSAGKVEYKTQTGESGTGADVEYLTQDGLSVYRADDDGESGGGV